jgi:hypothetical protein
MGMGIEGYLGSAFILAQKNATFINKWIDSYSSYNPNDWGGNSVAMATKLANEYPYIIQVYKHYCVFYPNVNYLFGGNYKWTYSYTLHIYKGGSIEHIEKLNFTSIRSLNTTVGAIFRFIFFGTIELCL